MLNQVGQSKPKLDLMAASTGSPCLCSKLKDTAVKKGLQIEGRQKN
jgi:hypothetical protein